MEAAVSRKISECEQSMVDKLQQLSTKHQDALKRRTDELMDSQRRDVENWGSVTERHLNDMITQTKNHISQLAQDIVHNIENRLNFITRRMLYYFLKRIQKEEA